MQRRRAPPPAFGIATTEIWTATHQTTFFSTPSNEAQKAMRRKCFVRSDVASEHHGYDGKHSRMMPMTVVSANMDSYM